MNWIYLKTQPQLWTVGFYRPDGTFEAETDWPSLEGAAQRVHYLNGGGGNGGGIVANPACQDKAWDL
jgi:hypothetical protein